MTVGADIRARHRDGGTVSGKSGGQDGGRNLSTRRPDAVAIHREERPVNSDARS